MFLEFFNAELNVMFIKNILFCVYTSQWSTGRVLALPGLNHSRAKQKARKTGTHCLTRFA